MRTRPERLVELGEQCLASGTLRSSLVVTQPLLALTDIETTFCAPDDPELEAEVAELTGSRVVSANGVVVGLPRTTRMEKH